MIEAWRKVWRASVEYLSTNALVALERALAEDDKRLMQGGTCCPPPHYAVQDWPVKAACAWGYAGVIEHGGFGVANVADVEEFFARLCFDVDQKLGEPAGCRHFLNLFDEEKREKFFPLLLAEVRSNLAERCVKEGDTPLIKTA